jgi:hypothetical protein
MKYISILFFANFASVVVFELDLSRFNSTDNKIYFWTRSIIYEVGAKLRLRRTARLACSAESQHMS